MMSGEGSGPAPVGDNGKGPTMLERHRDRIEKARREIATRKLHALVPEIGKLARTMALEETDFDTDRAVELLRRFQDKHGTELATLHERRVQFLKGRERRKNGSDVDMSEDSDRGGRGRDERRRKRSRRSDDSCSDSSGRSDSDSESERRRRRDGKRSKREKKDRKDRKSKKEKRSRKEKKREKRSHRSRSRSRSPSRGNAAGKYGFIQAGDVDQKRPEFTLWAREHERVDVDNLTRREEEVLFGRFVELFNTATLPHLKYYDLGRYERKKAEKYARLHGIRVVSREEAERERGRGRGRGRLEEEAEEERRREKEEKVRKAYDDMKRSGKVEEYKKRQMTLAEAQTAYKTGDVSKAQNLLQRMREGRG